MEWNVKNALNRDTERQHLNKILADIRATYNELANQKSNTGSVSLDALASAVEGNIEEGISVTYDPQKQTLDFVVNSFTIRLTGDVTGEGQVNALGSVTLTTELDPDLLGVEEAPIDNQTYWRKNAEWEAVSDAIFSFLDLKDEGIPVLYQDDVSHQYSWVIRIFEVEEGQLTVENPTGEGGNFKFGLADVEDSGTGSLKGITRDDKGRVTGTTDATITGTADEIDVANGDAAAGPPTLSLADLADSGAGTFKLLTRDSKGRLSGTEDGDTDDVPEGVSNLYFTDERAQDAIGTAIAAGTGDGATLDYDDVNNTLGVTNTDKGSVAVAAHEAAPDPHPQYLTEAEGDAAYAPLTHVGAGGTAHAGATTSTAGFMSAADKLKLDGIESGAEVNTVDSVNGQTGTVVLGASDVGAATAAQGSLADSAVQPGDLATVATTGSYDDLTDKPSIPAAQVNADWNAGSGVAEILNKPTLGTAAAADTSDFDAAGSASAAQAYAVQRGNHTGTQTASTISNFAATVRSTVLTGLSTATNAVIAATDTVLVAFGKLQAQISAIASAVSGLVVSTITDGDTTHAPSSDAVHDALAAKANTSSLGPFATLSAGSTDTFVRSDGTHAPTLYKATGNVILVLDAPNSGVADFRWHTGGTGAASGLRWVLRRHIDPEIGDNSGSSFRLSCYGDAGAGAPIGDALIIQRNDRTVRPGPDNTQNFGAAAVRWKEIFCANSTINTSDAREKATPRHLTSAELACALDLARLPCVFQWLHAIEEKGEDARLHVSPTVQDVIACMQSHGLDPFRYGFVCYDEWEETVDPAEYEEIEGEQVMVKEEVIHPAGSRYSLRPSEMAHFIQAAIVAKLDSL